MANSQIPPNLRAPTRVVPNSSAALSQYLHDRYFTTSEMVNQFNPERLHVHGTPGTLFNADPSINGYFAVFFTTPDINLGEEDGSNSPVNVLGLGEPSFPLGLARLLTGGTGFIKLLSNTVDGLPTQDIVLDTKNTGEGWDGSRLTVPKNTLNSRQDGTISLNFDEFAGIPITNMANGWIKYIENVTLGRLAPKTVGGVNYIESKTLDYVTSIYGFKLMPDLRTIELAIKFTGCFPNAVPLSAHSMSRGSTERSQVSIPFTYNHYEAQDPNIIAEFNAISGDEVRIVRNNKAYSDSVRTTYTLEYANVKSKAKFGI